MGYRMHNADILNEVESKLDAATENGKTQGYEQASKEFGDKLDGLKKDLEQTKAEAKKNAGVFTSRTVKEAPAFGIGALIYATANQKHNGKNALEFLKEQAEKGDNSCRQALSIAVASARSAGDSNKANQMEAQIKAMGVGDIASGGGLLEPGAQMEFIESLRPANAVRSSGVEVITAENGRFFWNKATSNITAYRKGENTALTASDMELGQVEGYVKKLTSLTYIANEMLRSGTNANFQYVQNNAINSINVKDDLDFLVGTGSDFAPLGIFNIDAGTASGGTTSSAIGKDLRNAVKRLANNNVPMDGWAWVMHPNNYYIIIDQRDANGQVTNYARRLEEQNQIFGQPVYQTTNAPIDEIALYRVNDLAIGQAYGITVDLSADAAFANDQTALRVVMSDDLVCKRTESVTKIKSIAWT